VLIDSVTSYKFTIRYTQWPLSICVKHSIKFDFFAVSNTKRQLAASSYRTR